MQNVETYADEDYADEDYADEDYDPTFKDFPYENTGDPAFCDNYVVHEAHSYRAINGNTYSCSGLNTADLAAFEAQANEPACPHGLSAWLCSDPVSHYGIDYD